MGTKEFSWQKEKATTELRMRKPWGYWRALKAVARTSVASCE